MDHLQMGSYPVVVLNDWPSIKQTFHDETALYRPKDNFFNTAFPAGFASISGDAWKEQKRVSNNVNSFNFGRRFDYTDSKKQAIDDFLKLDPNKMLEGNTLNLIAGGSLAIMQTVEWAVAILAINPLMQRHIHKEIDEVIGNERNPKFSDRNQMPYLQAFMWEVWSASKDMVISGFKIPKDTQILVNFWAIDNDPNLWENPTEFRPERLLSKDLKTFKKPEHLIPFSIGKRSCPGEILGVVETFLYLSSLLQKYEIKANHKTDRKLEYNFEFSIAPKHNPNITFIRRLHN
ncbi:unnamed protein product [Medioppia subpectinata]|uniref:Cytochrome P450 n=1 Tax=Medioppia subpectinata TaxID=1979941 RepID=A0A7R9KC17_9ACAR|nr:unnamed protein product [Medioppia subpectinata]CAG2100612.1 unnamed protein product [Medioppia subpectinata]